MYNFHKQPGYDPVALVDALIGEMGLKNDAALARRLSIPAPIISKVRNHRTPITAGLLLRMHEVSKLPVPRLRKMMGVPPAQ